VIALVRGLHRHFGAAAEHLGDDGLMPRVQMLDDDHRNREVGGQGGQYAVQRGNPPGGSGDGHDLVREFASWTALLSRVHRGT
jgi:hypothetical protein